MKWMIYIVTHGPIFKGYYEKDPGFSSKNWSFFNVSPIPIKHNLYSIINKMDIKFIELGKWWAEFEAIYNIYKSGIYKEYDYVGFVHYDFKLDHYGDYLISSLISKAINTHDFISFSTFDFSFDYNQRIMMDEKYPNTLVGSGKNCYINILDHYNNFFQKTIKIKDIWNAQINLCSSFLTKINIFEDMMRFISYIIESKVLDNFDTEHKYRFQGGMMERYIAVYSSQLNIYNLSLKHEK